jgi:hypothetical protein
VDRIRLPRLNSFYIWSVTDRHTHDRDVMVYRNMQSKGEGYRGSVTSLRTATEGDFPPNVWIGNDSQRPTIHRLHHCRTDPTEGVTRLCGERVRRSCGTGDMSASAAAVMWILGRLVPPGITSKRIAVPIRVSSRSLWVAHSITADPWGSQRTTAPASRRINLNDASEQHRIGMALNRLQLVVWVYTLIRVHCLLDWNQRSACA